MVLKKKRKKPAKHFDDDGFDKFSPEKNGGDNDGDDGEDVRPRVRGRFGQVVKYIEAFDVAAEHKRVVEAKDTVVDPQNRQLLEEHVEQSARITYSAASLSDVAQREYRNVKDRVEHTLDGWRPEALEYLTEEKAAGRLSKQITKDMVLGTVKHMRPQAYHDLIGEQRDAEMMRDNMRHLFETMRERMWNLRGLVGGQRSTPYEDASRETKRGSDTDW